MQVLFKKSTLVTTATIALMLLIIGFFLRALLIPIQDFHLLTEQQMKEAQLDYAVNYPLGSALMYAGFSFLFFVVILIVLKIIQSKTTLKKRDSVN